MNVLLIGGIGYIGGQALVMLSRLWQQFVLCDNLSNSSDFILRKLIQITRQQMLFIRGDARDTELFRGALTSHNVDAVIHLSG